MKFFLKNRAVFLGIFFLLVAAVAVAPMFVMADVTGSGAVLKNPLGDTKTLESLIDKIIQIFLNFFAIVAVIYLVYGGFLFIKAQGNPNALGEAKTNILWAIIGLAVILGAKAISTIVTNTISSLK